MAYEETAVQLKLEVCRPQREKWKNVKNSEYMISNEQATTSQRLRLIIISGGCNLEESLAHHFIPLLTWYLG